MSYILDALNKSEKERLRKQIPDLVSQGSVSKTASFTWKHFLAALALLALINIGVVYLLFGDRPGAAPETPDIQPESSPPRTTNSLASLPARAVPSSEIINTRDLPETAKALLPEIKITTHIYSEDPELRMVKINGFARHEGEFLAPNFQLLEVTETGIIMDFRRQVYRLDIVETWQEF